jgi:adenine-specific DNA-methyltransferase
MEKRIEIAKKLLTKRGVFICAIDENELHTIGLLIEKYFCIEYEIHCIAIVHNPNGTQGKNFSYAHEYAIFVLPKGDKIIGLQNRTASPDIRPLRDVSKGDNMRTDAKNCFYPIYVKDGKIIGFGEVCDSDFHPSGINVIREDGVIEIYPIDASGNERKWVFARQTVETIKNELNVEWNKSRKAFDIIRTKTMFTYKTFWDRKELNANIFGTKLLKSILPDCPFDFPKSLYNVRDCIGAILTRNNAVVLDFFAGSGTTGHAVLELNREDGGRRKFILCTNNENNICEEVTYQRIKTVITGKRKDGSEYSKGIAGSLKYFKVDFTPITDKLYYEYADTLLLHIKELVELENAIDFDHNAQIDILLDENQVEAFFTNEKKLAKVKTIYLGHDISLTLSQQKMATEHGIKINVIPEYYYKEKQI